MHAVLMIKTTLLLSILALFSATSSDAVLHGKIDTKASILAARYGVPEPLFDHLALMSDAATEKAVRAALNVLIQTNPEQLGNLKRFIDENAHSYRVSTAVITLEKNQLPALILTIDQLVDIRLVPHKGTETVVGYEELDPITDDYRINYLDLEKDLDTLPVPCEKKLTVK